MVRIINKYIIYLFIYLMNIIQYEQFINVQQEGLNMLMNKTANQLGLETNVKPNEPIALSGPIKSIIILGEKIHKLSSVANNDFILLDAETVRNTLMDIHNYSAVAVMLLDEKPPIHPRLKVLKQRHRLDSVLPNPTTKKILPTVGPPYF
jgi:hypothetical protein